MVAGEQLFTWEALNHIGSVSLLVFLITSYVKKFVKNLPTDIFALMIAFVILVLTNIATNPDDMLQWDMYILALFNAFMVASVSSHVQQKARFPVGQKNGD